MDLWNFYAVCGVSSRAISEYGKNLKTSKVVNDMRNVGLSYVILNVIKQGGQWFWSILNFLICSGIYGTGNVFEKATFLGLY